jgi:hypothetical protein
MKAQQDPQPAPTLVQHRYCKSAYAGSQNTACGVYIENNRANSEAPSSFSFSGLGQLGNNVGLGLSFLSDKIVDRSLSKMYMVIFSYSLQLGENRTLALGIKAELPSISRIVNSISLPDPNEGIFGQDISDVSLSPIGTGRIYYTGKYCI